jgi:hypothetical protein
MPAIEFEKFLRLQRGPLRLPREIMANRHVLQLFMAYIKQPATSDALEAAASERPVGSRTTAKSVMAARHELIVRVGVPRSQEELRLLVARAPTLSLVRKWASRIEDPRVLPEEAIPSRELIESCLAAYHHWVQVLSRTTSK